MGAWLLDIGSKVLSKAFGSANNDNGCSSHIKEGQLHHPLIQLQG